MSYITVHSHICDSYERFRGQSIRDTRLTNLTELKEPVLCLDEIYGRWPETIINYHSVVGKHKHQHFSLFFYVTLITLFLCSLIRLLRKCVFDVHVIHTKFSSKGDTWQESLYLPVGRCRNSCLPKQCSHTHHESYVLDVIITSRLRLVFTCQKWAYLGQNSYNYISVCP